MGILYGKHKQYPDGTQKTILYKEPMITDDNPQSNLGQSKPKTAEEIEQDREHSNYMNMVRTKTKIQDYILSNDFDAFWTLTFAKDRDDDQKAFNRLSRWLRYIREHYGRFDYIFIPERHKDGCMHFHGVTGGYPAELIDSGVKHNSQPVYNCKQWRYGFTEVTMIRDRHKTASYATKYVTKSLSQDIVGKGKKKYWSSRGLREPVQTKLDQPLILPDHQKAFENENVMIFHH